MVSDSIPQTMKAWTQNGADWLSINQIPVPRLKDNHVLIKVEYAPQNPTDWKHAVSISLPGDILGCDFAGTIVQLGPNLKVPLKIGDQIAGCVNGGWSNVEGSYAEYAAIESDMCFVVPEGMKAEEAATFGIGWVTAAQTIVYQQGKSFPPGDTKVSGNPWYIIYGASTSVGLLGISLAKALGYRVLGVCSPHSFDLVKSYGADAVVDYHDQQKAIAEALDITKGGVEYALDAISEGDSFKIIVGMMGDKGKQLNCILGVPEEVYKINPKLKIEWTLMHTMWGVEFDWAPRSEKHEIRPVRPKDRAFGEEIFRRTPELIAKYNIRPNPILMRGGFDDVEAGLKDLQSGKISGKKLVIKIA
ncbi:hypothetical protein D1P53_002838 [Cryptococcus gattii VGV]|nr:hypothetical protein D1P53_002838 [Cryptococcus gattii VGV]